MSALLHVRRPSAGVRPMGFARRAVATVLAAGAITGGFVALAPAPAMADSNVGGFLAHLNSLRASKGLGPLTMVSDLTSVAEAHSAAMLAQETIFHNQSLTSTIANWQTLGENVGMGPTVDALDNAFDHSPEHYANEVNATYTQVGIGSVTDSRGEIFVTLDFRKPMHPTAATSVPVPAKPAAPAAAAPVPATAPTKSTTAQRTPVKRTAVPWHRTRRTVGAAAASAVPNAATVAATSAHTAAAQQAATLTPATRGATDPVGRALQFAAAVNTLSY